TRIAEESIKSNLQFRFMSLLRSNKTWVASLALAMTACFLVLLGEHIGSPLQKSQNAYAACPQYTTIGISFSQT
ncbi:MAG: hypothetical protein ABI370_07225, partial [Gammaproteobacteria bacterium]